MKSATVIEVAQSAGISKTAASDILRGAHDRFRPETVQRVREAALTLGYHPNGAAQLLAKRNKTLIGLSVFIGKRPHFNHLVMATHQELEDRGYEPFLLEPPNAANKRPSAPFADPKLLAGVISGDLVLEGEVPHFYKTLQNALPVVALYPTPAREFEEVTVDQALVIETAARHLAELGHRRIAFANCEPSVVSEQMKWKGWHQSVEKFGLDSDTNLQITLPTTLASSIHQTSVEVVQRLREQRPRPTALICSSESLAMSCLSRLAEAGVKVPDELSVISYGVDERGTWTYPQLSIVMQPTSAIASLAAERLIALIESWKQGDKPRPQRHLIAPTLLARGSTAAVPAAK